MAGIDLVVFGLLGAGLTFAIIELGLSAYLENVFHQSYSYSYIGFDGELHYQTESVSTPGEIHLLLFCSIWTIVVVGALAVLQIFIWRGRNHAAGKIPSILTLVVNSLTMIFWLAGFAALADLYNGYTVTDIPAALLAFAVLSWLVFLALLILNILTAVSVLNMNTHGYGPFTTRSPTATTTATGATAAPTATQTTDPAAAPTTTTAAEPTAVPVAEPKSPSTAQPGSTVTSDPASNAPEVVPPKTEQSTIS